MVSNIAEFGGFFSDIKISAICIGSYEIEDFELDLKNLRELGRL
jgi:hypothetical protein